MEFTHTYDDISGCSKYPVETRAGERRVQTVSRRQPSKRRICHRLRNHDKTDRYTLLKSVSTHEKNAYRNGTHQQWRLQLANGGCISSSIGRSETARVHTQRRHAWSVRSREAILLPRDRLRNMCRQSSRLIFASMMQSVRYDPPQRWVIISSRCC
jgi:hypothetical protein